MKKLLIALTAVVSFAGVSFALVPSDNDSGFLSGTSFESLTPGNPLKPSADDEGGTGESYWGGTGDKGFFVGDDPGTISNDVVDVASRPAAWASIDEGETRNFLSVDTSDLLLRNVNLDRSSRDIGNGIYVDTVVQFTASDATTIDTDAADKLVVWMQTVDHDAEGDVEAYTETNLIVTAGSYAKGSAVEAVDYVVTVDGITVAPGEWHRLTIKSMKVGDDSSGFAAFVVFIDGVAVTCESLENAFGDVVVLDAVPAKWAAENALFPSLVDGTSGSAQTITSLGVEGSGFIDDIAFTTTAPDFAADGKLFTIAWTDGVKSFKYAVGDAYPIAVSDLSEAGSTIISFEGAFAAITISDVVYDTANGYSEGTWTVAGGASVTGSVFTPNAVGQSGTIVANKAFYQVGDTTYMAFVDAFAAAKGSSYENCGTIKLLSDITFAETVVEDVYPGALLISEGEYVVIDLAGKKIVGTSDSVGTIVNLGGYLTITNSTTELGEVAASQAGSSVDALAGGTIIYGGKYTGNVNGEDTTCLITAGTFVDPTEAETVEEFFYAGMVDENSTVTYTGSDYVFVVTAGGEEPPESGYAITWSGAETVNLTVTVNDGDPVESGDAFATGTEVYFEASAKTGYEFAEASYDGWNLAKGVLTRTVTIGTEDVRVEIPSATKKEEPVVENVTITITPNDKTSYAITSGADPVKVENDEAIVEKGSVYDVTATVTAEGYEFTATEGWALKDGKLTLSVDYAVEATIVIPAPTAIAYTITYMEGDAAAVFAEGAEVATTYTIEAAVTLPTADNFETRDGATFAGWFDNAECTGDAVTTIAAGLTGAKTFYAKWDEFAPGGEWDIPGVEGGINALVGEGGAKYVEFSSIAFTADGATVGLKAGKIDADGQTFGLVCKTDLTKEETIVINAELAAEKDAATGLFTITADLSGYPQLFVIGVGPAEKPE